jgi:hypothetical protein
VVRFGAGPCHDDASGLRIRILSGLFVDAFLFSLILVWLFSDLLFQSAWCGSHVVTYSGLRSLPRGLLSQAPPFTPAPLPLPPPVPSLPLPTCLLTFESQHLSSDPPLQHLLSPAPSLLLLHTLCCTQDQLICSSHFVFLSFAPLIVVGANGVVSFFVFSCIDSSIYPVFDCC